MSSATGFVTPLFTPFLTTLWQKIIAFVAASAGVVWLGGSVVRAALAFDLFVPGTLTFKPELSNEATAQTIRLFGVTAFYTLIGYGIFVVLAFGLWIAARRLWKRSGGVFIAGMLVFLYIPVECVQMWHDVQIIMLIQDSPSPLLLDAGVLAEAKTLVLKRFSVLSGVPLLAGLGYFTAIFMLLAQTLRQTPHEHLHAAASEASEDA
jgi:hypothetical protein